MTTSGRMAVGHPVDVATGTLFNYYSDYSIRGAIPLSFVRYYSTALIAAGTGPLGVGFRHNYQHELRQSLEGFVYVDCDGGEHTFQDDGSFAARGKLFLPGKQLELRGTKDRIEIENYGARSEPLVFVRRPNSQHYDLTAILFHANNRLDLFYDAEHKLTKVVQTRSGTSLSFKYDSLGRILEVICDSGRRDIVVRLSYDAQGDLVTVTDPLGVYAQYQYDNHLMVSESTRSSSVHEFRFDGRGRCVRASGPDNYELRELRYDSAARTTVVTDSKGAETKYEYNDSGQILKLTDALGQLALYSYDDLGRLASETTRKQITFSREYDQWGHVSRINYPGGVTYEMVWDEQHTLQSATGPEKRPWKYVYDEHRQLIESENPLGHKHYYEYDAYGQIAVATTPLNTTYRYSYDARGYLASFVDARGATTARENDDHGNVLRLMDANGVITEFAYDSFDRPIQVTDGEQKLWRYTYDAQGRLSREQYPAGHSVEYFYNTCGLMVAVRRADGVVSKCDWDTEPGRILAVHDGNGNTLRYRYDALGRVIERTNWDGSVLRIEHDAHGNISAIEEADGSRQEYFYDDFDQMIERRSGEERAKFEYDVNGFMTAAVSKAHEVRWERDLYGRPTAEVQHGERIEYTYDALGRRTSMLTALGDTVEYGWEPTVLLKEARMGGASVSFRHDARGREVERSFLGGAKFQRAWDAMGRLVNERFTPPQGSPKGPLNSETLGRAPVPFDRSYTYDYNGHLQLIRDALRGSTELFHDLVGQIRSVTRFWGYAEYYDFDAAYNRVAIARIASQAPPSPQQIFAPGAGPHSMNYGALAASGADVSRELVGPGNRLHTIQKNSETITYEFDAAGFVKEKRVSRGLGYSEIWKFDWDADGRLTALERPDGTVWRYEYDPMGRRMKKIAPSGAATRFFWDGDRVLHVLSDDQDPTTYVYDPTNFNVLMCKRGAETMYALPDQSTAISELVRPDGVAVWWRWSEAWGKSLTNHSLDVGFTGQWLDLESGLFYNHFRYYDADLGRYLSPDPIGLLGGLNEYAFVPSPFEAFDPDGLAKALGGGPMQYTGGYDRQGRPTLRDTRTVRDRNGQPPYNDRTVPSPGRSGNSADAGGKCLAVTRGPEGQTNAFVSGQGRPGNAASPNVPSNWGVTPGQMGNWTHAEVQALNHIRQTGQRGQTYDLYIDRPCCPRCQTAVPSALADLESNHGITVRVHFMETGDEGRTRWQSLPDASHGGCH